MDYLKKFLKSKTVRVGLAQILVAISLYLTGEQNLNELLVGAGGLLMIIMRTVTTIPIQKK